MALSRTVQYALRATVWLARLPEGARASSDTIAAETQVPPAFLRKVLRRLVAAGLLSAERGHRGGYALARPAAGVRFLDVIAALDEGPGSVDCAYGWPRCDPSAPCPLHHSFVDLDESLLSWAGRHTVAGR